jgi:hypothetical protein
MKHLLLLALFALPLRAQEGLDFRSLDKLDALAKNKTRVTLDAGMLKLAAGFLGDDKDSRQVRGIVENLKGIYVRTYEFDKKDAYTQADIEPLRTSLKQQQWSWIVQSQEGKDFSDIYIQPLQSGGLGGVAIISGEARELTVVYISGAMSFSDLEKLGGNMGVPRINLKGARNMLPKGAATKDKEEDEKDNR